MNNTNKTVSNVINLQKIDRTKVNLIQSGVGTGKSYFALNTLISRLHNLKDTDLRDIKPHEIILVTSRKITEEQQANDYAETSFELTSKNIDYYEAILFDKTNRFFGSCKKTEIENKIPVTNYSFFNKHFDVLSNVKVFIFDEYHAIKLDGTFSEDMQNVDNNIIPQLLENNKLVIAMTATIAEFNTTEFNQLIDPLFKYKIKNIHFVSNRSLLDNIITKLEGNTLALIFSAKEVLKYESKYPNSIGIISKYRNEFDERMEQNFNYILQNKTLPNNYNILFCTSALREGWEFNQAANVQNVIVENDCSSTVIQIMGRARQDIEHLYILPSHNWTIKTPTQERQHRLFLDIVYKHQSSRGVKRHRYIKYLQDVITDNTQIDVTTFRDAKKDFINYMIDNWTNRIIYTKEQKQEIVNYAHKLGLKYTDQRSKYTFNSLMTLLRENRFNFIMEGKQIRTTNKQLQKYITEEIKENRISPIIITFSDKRYIKYLEEIKGLKLNKNEQVELLKISNRYFNTPNEIKTIGKLNEKLLSLGYILKATSVGRKKNRTTIWILEKK